jgi:hypothetical protein
LEDLIDTLTRGNATEVKVLLASVALALAVYQLVLIAVGYGKLRPPFLGAGPAARTLVALDGPLLPALGMSVWLLLALTWLTSAGDFLELT